LLHVNFAANARGVNYVPGRIMGGRVDLDTTGWELAEQLPHGKLFWLEPGLVAAVPDDGVIETPELARVVYEGYRRCSQVFGRPIAIVVFVDHLGDQTPEVREFWAKIMQPDVLCATALVCSSFFARAVGAFFMGIRKPVVPTRMFPTLDRAVAWSQQRLLEDADAR